MGNMTKLIQVCMLLKFLLCASDFWNLLIEEAVSACEMKGKKMAILMLNMTIKLLQSCWTSKFERLCGWEVA